jgi:hypothetical protein
VQFLEGGDSDRVERDRSRVSVLGFGKMDLPAFEIDQTPIETVLFADPHPGMDGQKKVRQELLEPMLDGSAETNLLRVGQESDAPFRRIA